MRIEDNGLFHEKYRFSPGSLLNESAVPTNPPAPLSSYSSPSKGVKPVFPRSSHKNYFTSEPCPKNSTMIFFPTTTPPLFGCSPSERGAERFSEHPATQFPGGGLQVMLEPGGSPGLQSGGAGSRPALKRAQRLRAFSPGGAKPRQLIGRVTSPRNLRASFQSD